MYSKNDYRYYLENQLIHSDDFLVHYGVKGMKWKNHKTIDVAPGSYPNLSKYTLDGKIKREWYDNPSAYEEKAKNIRSSIENQQRSGMKRTAQERIRQEQERGKKRTAQIKARQSGSSEYKNEVAYNSKTNKSKNSGTSKPTKKKSKISNLRKKYGLYRTTPKGKKLKGGGNIYVSHS